MSFLIFLIGTTIFLSYIFFFSYFEKEEKKNTIKIDDAIDYDGHGNWGRFPPPKKSKDLKDFEWERKKWKEQTHWRWW
jgi:hypothetical protein